MFLIGLTGGIASGKSTVARLFASHGATIIDADQVARDVVAPGSDGLEAVVKEFGPDVRNESGGLNREELARIVFADPDKRRKLESLLHPLIKLRTTELIESSDSSVVVYAVPLLVEANVDYPFDMILTVEAGVENQIQRLTGSRGLTRDEAVKRIEAQATESERRERADFVIDSSGPISKLDSQVESLWEKIQEAAKGKRN